MDQLLEKIARTGKESLTDEEKRFLERVQRPQRNSRKRCRNRDQAQGGGPK